MNNKDKKTIQKPWITNYILTKINHRNALFKQKKSKPNDLYLKQAYNRFRNSVNRDIKKSKENFHLNFFENCAKTT